MNISRKLTKIVLSDVRLKILALLIAVLIWGYARGRLRREMYMDVPLTLEMPPEYVKLYQSADSVQLRMSGPEDVVRRLSTLGSLGRLRMVRAIGPSELDEQGYAELAVEPKWLEAPRSDLAQLRFGANSIEPALVTVYASRRKDSKMLPVHVNEVGGAPAGYIIRSRSIPRTARVTGPARVLDNMASISTRAVYLDERRQSTELEVELVQEDTFLLASGMEETVELEVVPRRVTVVLAVSNEREARASQKTFRGIPVGVLSPPKLPFEVDVPPEGASVDVTVSGPPDRVSRLKPGDVTAFVRLGGLMTEEILPGRSAPYKEAVRVVLPEGMGLSVMRVEPETITVILKKPME